MGKPFHDSESQPNKVVARIWCNHCKLCYMVLRRYSINTRHFILNSPLFLLCLCWVASPMESLLTFPGLANDSLFVPMCFPRTYHQHFPRHNGNNLFMCVSPHMGLNVHQRQSYISHVGHLMSCSFWHLVDARWMSAAWFYVSRSISPLWRMSFI